MARSLRADAEAASHVEAGPVLDELVARLRALGESEASGGIAPPPLSAGVRDSFNRFALAGGAGAWAIPGVRAKLATEFVRAVDAHDEPEVRALGGAFLANARRWGIVRDDGSLDRDRCSPFLLRALYKARLALLAGDPADAPLLSRAERIAVESFVLAGAAPSPAAPTASIERRARALDGLQALDPEYPARLAGGVLFAGAGRLTEAEADLMEHLAAHPRDGRARNWLLWVRGRLDPGGMR